MVYDFLIGSFHRRQGPCTKGLRAGCRATTQIRNIRAVENSNDPEFAAKAAEIVGLYLNPPGGAPVA